MRALLSLGLVIVGSLLFCCAIGAWLATPRPAANGPDVDQPQIGAHCPFCHRITWVPASQPYIECPHCGKTIDVLNDAVTP